MSVAYPSKLMLFGEYAVIAGGEGLAIPYPEFSASWVINIESPSAFKSHLILFLNWLKENHFEDKLNLTAFELDLAQGLDIQSNVPIGYGVGSSGVVVAAVFDKYHKQVPSDLNTLKSVLASMENYFHATSSGLDPLVCYLNKGVHIKNGEVHVVENRNILKNINFHLIDCGNARSTQQLVTQFKEKMLDADFKNIVEDYAYLSNNCIAAWLNNDEEALAAQLKLLSYLQLNYFEFAIPADMRDRWKSGLENNTEIMKLCGAGGGGFLIGFNLPNN
mgnify:FL=1